MWIKDTKREMWSSPWGMLAEAVDGGGCAGKYAFSVQGTKIDCIVNHIIFP